MKTMKWLIRREFWENKGMFVWAPLVVSAVLVLFLGATMIYGVAHGTVHMNMDSERVRTAVTAMTEVQRADLASAIARSYLGVATPVVLMFSVTAFFYCLGALFDERRDRSILFWKSLPVSDAQTVASKIATALVAAPLITLAAATATAAILLILLLATLAVFDVNIIGLVMGNPAVYLSPLQLFSLLPVYILWALPTVGWLLMVSSWARSKTFLWAVGVPLLSVVLVKWANHLYNLGWNVDWYVRDVVLRLLGGLFPGNWLIFERVNLHVEGERMLHLGKVVSESWMTLGGPSVWIGAAAGVTMIAVALRMRRWKDEG